MTILRLYIFHFIEEGFESTQLVHLYSRYYPKARVTNYPRVSKPRSHRTEVFQQRITVSWLIYK
jgi:uncharacterized Fe-S radical SAM superfamily protein PflX